MSLLTSLGPYASFIVTSYALVAFVVVALIAGIALTAFGIAARTVDDSQTAAHVVKAGKPITVTSSTASMVR